MNENAIFGLYVEACKECHTLKMYSSKWLRVSGRREAYREILEDVLGVCPNVIKQVEKQIEEAAKTVEQAQNAFQNFAPMLYTYQVGGNGNG